MITTKTLGNLTTSAFGLGCMAMSGAYGATDRGEAIATIHAALDAGITLLDTGDFYGAGHNELLIAEALRGAPRDTYQLSVKFGGQMSPDGAFIGFDARPATVKASLAYSLQRLGVEHVDVYRPARIDPAVPIEDTVGAIGELIDAGHVRHVGLSEVGPETIRRAAAVRPISDVQIEYSLATRQVEREILSVCRELDIGITAYGVLARGLIGGHWSKDARTGRPRSPRFADENLQSNLALVEQLRGVARDLGLAVAQAAIAWVASRGPDIVPLIGARTRVRLAEALGTADVVLDEEQLARIESAIPVDAVRGDRYPAALMATLDSER